MNTKKLIGLLLLIAMLAAVGTLLYYSFFVIDAITQIPMDVTIADHPGFNVGNDSFHFGQIVAPGAGWRKVTIKNSKLHSLLIDASTSGGMDSWMIIVPNHFRLKPGEEETMTFRIEVPEGTAYGTYNGTAKIIFKR